MLSNARAHLASLIADLAGDRLHLARLRRNGFGSTFFPWASPIPREARKSPRRHSPLRCGPQAGASAIVPGLSIAIEAAVIAGSKTANRRSNMANIGSFKKVGGEFQGEIITLSVQAKGVRIVPDNNRSNENAPSHRVYVGRAEIGAAGRSAPKRAATTSRSSSTIRPSTRRSTRTCSTTRAAKATPSSGPGRARTGLKTTRRHPARQPRAGFSRTRHTPLPFSLFRPPIVRRRSVRPKDARCPQFCRAQGTRWRAQVIVNARQNRLPCAPLRGASVLDPARSARCARPVFETEGGDDDHA
jgi:uncharacterized protein (DUF736 family)